jgi:hypothetical protein
MSGGVIAGNTDHGVSNAQGDIPVNTTFTKTGGVIYGSEAANGLKNNSGAVNDSVKGFSEPNTLWEGNDW